MKSTIAVKRIVWRLYWRIEYLTDEGEFLGVDYVAVSKEHLLIIIGLCIALARR
jgi:hypothetical protein